MTGRATSNRVASTGLHHVNGHEVADRLLRSRFGKFHRHEFVCGLCGAHWTVETTNWSVPDVSLVDEAAFSKRCPKARPF